MTEGVTVMWQACHKSDWRGQDGVVGESDERFGVQEMSRFDQALAQEMESVWQERKRVNPKLYNGSKFRLAMVEEREKLVLQVGKSDYRAFLTTNCLKDRQVLAKVLDLGKQHFQNERAFLADPLGVGALVVTTDGKWISMERSHLTGEYQGYVDLPGGHPEPSRAAEQNFSFVEELFFSIMDEVICEINIPKQHLKAPQLVAIIRQQGQSHGRPSALFIIECDLDSERVHDLYKQGGSEVEESNRLYISDFSKSALETFALEHENRLTPQCSFALKYFAAFIA